MSPTNLPETSGQWSLRHGAPSRWLASVAENATLALFILDERQHCVFMNPAAERLTGFRLGEVQGRPLHDVVHHTRPDGRRYPIEECPIDRAFPRNVGEQGEEIFIHRDGSFYPVAFTASPVREDGRTIGTIVEVRDLRAEGARVRERVEQARLVDVLQRIGAALTSELDVDRIVQTVTDEATRFTGAQFGAFFYNVLNEKGESYTLYTISGVPREAFSKFPMPRNTQIFEPTFRGTGVVRSDDITKDPRYGHNAPYFGMPKGHLPVVSHLAVPVLSRTSEVLGGLFFGHERAAVFTDAHERFVVGIAAWAAVAIDNARLIDAERRARTEAETANAAKSQFLATMSHELRTPLNAIGGYVDLIQMGIRGPTTAEQREDLLRIQRSQQHLLGLINDVLNFAKLEAGQVEIHPGRVALHRLLSDIEALIRPQVDAKGLTYEYRACSESLAVLADEEKLRQVLLNLVTNALKFTDAGGTIAVECATSGTWIDIHVRDTGAGIAADKLGVIFEPFVRVDSALTRTTEGTGLGLAISRDLTRAMGGELTVESTEGEGSCFSVRLPAAQAPDE